MCDQEILLGVPFRASSRRLFMLKFLCARAMQVKTVNARSREKTVGNNGYEMSLESLQTGSPVVF